MRITFIIKKITLKILKQDWRLVVDFSRTAYFCFFYFIMSRAAKSSIKTPGDGVS